MSNLSITQNSLCNFKGVGAKIAEKLSKLHIFNITDMLFHLPFRYLDKTRIYPIADLKDGQFVTIEGLISNKRLIPKPRRTLLITLSDQNNNINIRFFYFNATQLKSLQPGLKLRCFGQARISRYGLEMVHPEYKIINPDVIIPVEKSLTPIYHTTEGVSQIILRNLANQAIQFLSKDLRLDELIPEEFSKKFQYSLSEAINFLHKPTPDVSLESLTSGNHPARKRIAFEELLAHHLSLKLAKDTTKNLKGYKFNLKKSEILENFYLNLPFALTNAQNKVFSEIKNDLEKDYPMMRLVQGDVGCGKTVIAMLSSLCAISNKYQTCLMAPTEILSEQHFSNFTKLMSNLNIKIELLISKIKPKDKKSIKEKIALGEVDIIIGTHALFQDDVEFKNLGLIIIDEQHRFGVEQRLKLKEKGFLKNTHPHQLLLTATPIPRTLAQTFYADLDCSVIDELPPGRKPIKTVVLPNTKRLELIESLKNSILEKKQAYWICALIEESDELDCSPAINTYQELSNYMGDIKIGLIHGKMKPLEKEKVMNDFKENTISLLIATTVIEVGVDVPNASIMIIEDPDRFGLSQLHQLRGRIGRGNLKSNLVLLYKPPLSSIAKERLEIMRKTQDGFEIAQKDLELRGPGELLGTRQTGTQSYKVANLALDANLFSEVNIAANKLVNFEANKIPKLINRWLPKKINYNKI